MLPHVKNQSALSFKNFENPEHTMRTRPLSYACLLFATLCGAYFLVFFQRLSLGVIMPSLTEELGLTPSMTGWLGSAFLYAYAATQIPAGLLVDNWGPRRTMLLLFGMGGVGGLLFASAASLGTALAGRALVGVGMAVVTTASFKIMSNWFRAGIYARLVSIFMATGGLGTFFAAAPLAALNTAFGWRPVFRGIAVFSLFWGALLWLMVKDAPSRGQERTPALSSMQRPACIRSGCAHPPGVSAEDRHKRAPESSTSPADILRTFRILFSSPQYRLIVLWYLTGASLFFSFAGLWAGDYYRRVHGLSAESLGALLSLGSLSLILGTPAGAWLSDRLHSRRAVLIIGSVCALGSSLSLCFSSAPLPLWALWLQFGGICVAGNATASAVFASARELLPPSVLGLSTSMLSLSIFGCTACLQAVIGGLLETFSALGPEQAYAHAFSVYLVFASVSLAAALMFRPSGHQA